MQSFEQDLEEPTGGEEGETPLESEEEELEDKKENLVVASRKGFKVREGRFMAGCTMVDKDKCPQRLLALCSRGGGACIH